MKFLHHFLTKHPYLISFFCGALLSFGLPPYNLPILLCPAFIGFYLCLSSAESPKKAAKMGFFFGFSTFLFMFYWTVYAIFTNLSAFWWVIPFALFGIPLMFSLYIVLLAYIFSLFTLPPLARIILFAFLWSVFEYIRGVVFTGIPWNLIGYSWGDTLPILQSASLVGIYGLGLWTVLLALSPLVIVSNRSSFSKPVILIFVALFYLKSSAVIYWGMERLKQAPTPENYESQPKTIRLVQPNTDQKLKWNQDYWPQIVKNYVDLTTTDLPDQIEMILWGETAVPYVLNINSELRQYLAKMLKPHQVLATGGLRVQQDESGQKPNIWNSLLVLNSEAEITQSYDKFHLLPFGEYIPFRSIIPLASLASGEIDFSEGPGPQTLKIKDFPSFSPLICFESIFPTKVVDPKNRPDWLMVISNDAWFADSAGPKQHYQISALRAIEEGLPIIRLATSGISGVISPYGQNFAKTELMTEAVLDVSIPPALPPTFFSKHGNLLYFLMLSGLFLLILILYTIEKPRYASKNYD